jgi:hypothetical protein
VLFAFKCGYSSHMSLKQCVIDSAPYSTKFHQFLFLVGGICYVNCLKILSKVSVAWPVLVSRKHFQFKMEILFQTHFTRRILRKILFIISSLGRYYLLSSVPCHRFAACRRSVNGVEVIISPKLLDYISCPQFHLSLLGSLASLWTWRHLATKVGTSKGGGKVMATYP